MLFRSVPRRRVRGAEAIGVALDGGEQETVVDEFLHGRNARRDVGAVHARGRPTNSLGRTMTDTNAPSLPTRARVVVIGGGVIGTSVAYHLGHLGWTDTVLVERDQLTSGTTWHAAGLMVTFGSTSQTSTDLRRYTRDLYSRLEAETGLATGFKPVGFIELAADEGRLEEYRRVAAFNRHCGVDVHEI